MLMYLYGSDAYTRTAALRTKIIAPYLAKYPDASVVRFYLDEEGVFSRLQEFSGTGSLFAKVKLAVLYNSEELDEKLEKEFILFLKSLLEDASTTVVVVAQKKLPKAFDFLLKEPVKTYEFEPLEGAKFAALLKHEAQAENLKVSDELIKKVSALYEGDTWAAVTELRSIAHGAGITASSTAPEFFPMMQALKSQSASSRLKALFYVLETIEPAAAFNTLTTLVSGGDKIKMADYDVAIKSGKLEYEEALTDFVI